MTAEDGKADTLCPCRYWNCIFAKEHGWCSKVAGMDMARPVGDRIVTATETIAAARRALWGEEHGREIDRGMEVGDWPPWVSASAIAKETTAKEREADRHWAEVQRGLELIADRCVAAIAGTEMTAHPNRAAQQLLDMQACVALIAASVPESTLADAVERGTPDDYVITEVPVTLGQVRAARTALGR